MGVEARIVLYAPDQTTAENAARAAYARIEELEQAYSDYRATSELMRLCAGPVGLPQSLGPDLARLLPLAARIGQDSKGAFDVTVGPLVQVWRAAIRERTLPDPAVLAAASARSGWRHLLLEQSSEAVTLTLLVEGMRLDLGGIGKGDAAQQAVERLASLGINRCLVAISGDIVVGEAPPGSRGWVIGAAPAGHSVGALRLRRGAVSTSGDHAQYAEIGGVRFSHVLDPRTGLGSTTRVAAAVMATRGELADALASALCVLDPDSAEELIRRYPGTGALIWTINDDSDALELIPRVIDPHGVMQRALVPRQ